MVSAIDTLSVSDISWLTAMESAATAVARAQELSDRFAKVDGRRSYMKGPEYITADTALAQAWIALAREITMHARAAQ
jgi:hypothetical protein